MIFNSLIDELIRMFIKKMEYPHFFKECLIFVKDFYRLLLINDNKLSFDICGYSIYEYFTMIKNIDKFIKEKTKNIYHKLHICGAVGKQISFRNCNRTNSCNRFLYESIIMSLIPSYQSFDDKYVMKSKIYIQNLIKCRNECIYDRIFLCTSILSKRLPLEIVHIIVDDYLFY
jgi:hypothetical protein